MTNETNVDSNNGSRNANRKEEADVAAAAVATSTTNPAASPSSSSASDSVVVSWWRWFYRELIQPSMVPFEDPEEEAAFVEYIYPNHQYFQLFTLFCISIMSCITVLVSNIGNRPAYDSGAQIVIGTLGSWIFFVVIAICQVKKTGWYGPRYSEWSWMIIAMIWSLGISCSWTVSLMLKCRPAFVPSFVAMVVANPNSEEFNSTQPVPWIVQRLPTYQYNLSSMHRCANQLTVNYSWTTLMIFVLGLGRVYRILGFYIFDIVFQFVPRWIFLAIGNTNDTSPNGLPIVRFYRSDALKIYYYLVYFVMFIVRERRLRFQFRSHRHLLEQIKRASVAKVAVEGIMAAILPVAVLDRMLRGEQVVDVGEMVTVLFSDVANFTSWSQKRSAADVGLMLNCMYRRVDQDLEIFGVDKISTIGDAYWAACGLPNPVRPLEDVAPNTVGSGCVRMVAFALQMQRHVATMRALHDQHIDVHIRIGVATGAATGGIVGTRQLAYQIFGPVNEEAEGLERFAPIDSVVICYRTKELVEHIMQEMLGYGAGTGLGADAGFPNFAYSPGPLEDCYIADTLLWLPEGIELGSTVRSLGLSQRVAGGGSGMLHRSAVESKVSGGSESAERPISAGGAGGGGGVAGGGGPPGDDGSMGGAMPLPTRPESIQSSSHRSRQYSENGRRIILLSAQHSTHAPVFAHDLADMEEVPQVDLEELQQRLSTRKHWWSTAFADDEQEEDFANYAHELFQSRSSVGVNSFIQCIWLLVALIILASESVHHAYPAPVYILYCVLLLLSTLNCIFATSIPAWVSYVRISMDYCVQLIALWFWIRAPYSIPAIANAGVQPRFSLLSGDVSYITFTATAVMAGLGTPRYIHWLTNSLVAFLCIMGPTGLYWQFSGQFVAYSFINMIIVIPISVLPGALRIEVSQRTQYIVNRVATVAHAEIQTNIKQMELLLSRTVPSFAIPELISWLSTSDDLMKQETVISHSVPHTSIMFIRVPAIHAEISATGVDPTAAFRKVSVLAELYDSVISGTYEDPDVLLAASPPVSTSTIDPTEHITSNNYTNNNATATGIGYIDPVMAAILKTTTIIKVKTIGDIALIAAGLHRAAGGPTTSAAAGDQQEGSLKEATSMSTSGGDGFSLSHRYDVVFDAQALAYVGLRLMQVITETLARNGEPSANAVVGGMNSGPVITGVLGDARLVYDVFGDTVNTASRVMSTSFTAREMGIWVSQATAELLTTNIHPRMEGSEAWGEDDHHDVDVFTPGDTVGLYVDTSSHSIVRSMKGKGDVTVRRLLSVKHRWIKPTTTTAAASGIATTVRPVAASKP